MSHTLTFDTTLTITLADTEAEFECRVTGTYIPFRKGDGPMSYYGPTPDEPEAFELSAVFARPDETQHFREIPTWLIAPAQFDALEREAIEAHGAQRDEALIRQGEERREAREMFGEGDDA